MGRIMADDFNGLVEKSLASRLRVVDLIFVLGKQFI